MRNMGCHSGNPGRHRFVAAAAARPDPAATAPQAFPSEGEPGFSEQVWTDRITPAVGIACSLVMTAWRRSFNAKLLMTPYGLQTYPTKLLVRDVK